MNLNLYILTSLVAVTFATSLISNEVVGTYTIIEAEGRTFLLNTETGHAYRYFFNSIDKQGWTQTFHHVGNWEGKTHFRSYPSGDLISVQDQENVTDK